MATVMSALLAAAIVLPACAAQPDAGPPIDRIVQAARADAAQRSGLLAAQLLLVSAESGRRNRSRQPQLHQAPLPIPAGQTRFFNVTVTRGDWNAAALLRFGYPGAGNSLY
jgi:hypothetical protein